MKFTSDQLIGAKSRDELIAIAKKNKIPIEDTLDKLRYEKELYQLQTELAYLQKWVEKNKLRVAIIFEGRDAAGKGGSIKRFTQNLNPRSSRIVALNKPTDVERGQWYFRRYIKVLPNPGEIVFFDRSWYNRAVVEPVMGFCTDAQYHKFIMQVPEFEHLLYEDNLKIIKLWFDISKGEQQKRFQERQSNPLKKWKFSAVDMKGQDMWNRYTHFIEEMFSKTHTSFAPWMIVNANDKKNARVESIRYVLSQFDYEGKGKTDATLFTDPNIIMRYHRSIISSKK